MKSLYVSFKGSQGYWLFLLFLLFFVVTVALVVITVIVVIVVVVFVIDVFCCSCGSNLLTGQKPVENLNTEAETHEEDEEIVSISSNIPPLELDMQACYFPKRDSQALGSLVKPAKDAGENEDT